MSAAYRRFGSRSWIGVAAVLALLSCSSEPTKRPLSEVADLLEEYRFQSDDAALSDASGPATGSSESEVPIEGPFAGSLLLAFDEPMDFFMKLPRGAVLRVDSLRAQSRDVEPEVHVALTRVGGSSERVGTLKRSMELREIDLGMSDREIVRLSLLATGAGAGGVVLRGVKIYAPSEAASVEEQPPSTAAVPKPNIIVFMIDTMRADHLGIYGYPKPVSPEIDSFGADAVVFDDMVAQAPWTKPSVASVFSGVEPHLSSVQNFETNLPESVDTLAELLRDDGYRPEGHISNLVVREQHGFGQGFAIYKYGGQNGNDSNHLMERLLNFLQSERRTWRPFFLYAHAMDPHVPYTPPAETKSRFAAGVSEDLGDTEVLKKIRSEKIDRGDPRVPQIEALYDAEIAFMDSHFGRMLRELKNLGLYDDSLIVVLGDHGEEFWENGSWGHGHSFRDEVLSIPLIIKPPRWAGGLRVGNLVQHVDVFATILDYAGIAVPEQARGLSLRALIEDRAWPSARTVYSHINFRGHDGAAVTTDSWRLVLPRSWKLGTKPRLIDRATNEVANLEEHPVIAGYLLAELRRAELAGTAPDVSTTEMTPEAAEQLKALGYL